MSTVERSPVHWIIGTAGHIDHGKTSLVKALTGQDTDRLKAEKERGISIDLGFAWLDLANGARAGVVDVPGHERFIRNMLAGAHAIDLVLFTVAADDGVMPQTVEHLEIIHLLGVSRAIFVITKADLASEQRLESVSEEIRQLAANSSLEGSPIVAFSAVTGAGLARLRGLIDEMLVASDIPHATRYFRLPVDRAFMSPGHGVIVTGTAVSGEVRRGEIVRCLPGADLLRVRRIEVALNLTGSTRTSIERGDVIAHEAITLICDRFDALVEVRPTASAGLKNHQRVRVHVGTAERMGKVIPLGSRARPGRDHIAPGETAYCQIAVSPPLAAMRGDRFILRDETAQRTIGGGVVTLPAAPAHKRSDAALLRTLEIFEQGEAAGAAFVAALVGGSGELTIALTWLAQRLNRSEHEVRALFDGLDGVHLLMVEGSVHYASEATCRDIKNALLAVVTQWHAAHPLSSGLDIEDARANAAVQAPARIFRILVDELAGESGLVREGSLLRLTGHRIVMSGADAAVVDRVIAILGRTPLSPPDLKQIAAELLIDRRRLIELLRVMERQQSIVCVAPDLYFLGDCINRVKDELIGDLAGNGGITTGQFRDRYQTSRKYAIPLLEYFDRAGVTLRIGEVRRLRRPVTETT
jgi:selenocysteine-specific elongation factor